MCEVTADHGFNLFFYSADDLRHGRGRSQFVRASDLLGIADDQGR